MKRFDSVKLRFASCSFSDIVVVVQSVSPVQLFCDTVGSSLPGPSVHGIPKVRTLLVWGVQKPTPPASSRPPMSPAPAIGRTYSVISDFFSAGTFSLVEDTEHTHTHPNAKMW